MNNLVNKYLWYLHEFAMPSLGLMPARQPAGYKHAPGPISKTPEEEEEEEKETKKLSSEYASYNPHGSGYGMLLQRWSSATSSGARKDDIQIQRSDGQKPSKMDIKVSVKTDKNKKKGDEDEEDI